MKPELASALAAAAAAGLPESRLMLVRELFSKPSMVDLPPNVYRKAIDETIELHLEDHERVITTPVYQAAAALEAAFFGTLERREDSPRMRHKHDGWRDQQSHPFRFNDRTFDVIQPTFAADATEHEKRVAEGLAADATRAQYEYLRSLILASR